MARAPKTSEQKQANLTINQMREAIPRLKRRIDDLKAFDVVAIGDALDEQTDKLVKKIDATMVDIFGPDTVEYRRYGVHDIANEQIAMGAGRAPIGRRQEWCRGGIRDALAKLESAVEYYEERVGDSSGGSPADRVIHAYKGLELHSEIARAASPRYLNGQYADAVEASVKALNNLVRLRSNESLDGTPLMLKVFSANAPLLRFNDLKDQSDKDEQQGFMYLFAGAVMGLRNPRAHGFINDDPERALEFIAFVSLLAKLLDGAKP
jgi:uncharacterized protein (TIGR02391 family)